MRDPSKETSILPKTNKDYLTKNLIFMVDNREYVIKSCAIVLLLEFFYLLSLDFNLISVLYVLEMQNLGMLVIPCKLAILNGM